MLDLVPLARPRWAVTDRAGKLELVGQPLQFDLPYTHTISVAAAAVRADHQSFGFRMAFLSHRAPPSPDRIDRKAGGIMIGADADPSDIVGDVVNAVRNSAAQLGIDKIMNLDQLGRAFWAPLAAIVLEIAHQFLLFRINRNDRLIGSQERLGLPIDVLKLGVAVEMLASCARLAVGLQAIAHAAQKIADNRRRDVVPLVRQRYHEVTQAAARPQQGPHRVASRGRRNQALEIDHEGRILDGLPLAPAALLADSPRRSRYLVANVRQSAINRGARQAGNLRHQTDAAATQGPRFQSHKTPPALLVQNRRHLTKSLAGGLHLRSANHAATLRQAIPPCESPPSHPS